MVEGREEWVRGLGCRSIDSVQSRCQVVEFLCVVVTGVALFLSAEKKRREMMIETDAISVQRRGLLNIAQEMPIEMFYFWVHRPFSGDV